MRGYNELSEAEIAAIAVLDRDSVGVEGAEILRSSPSEKAVDTRALYWAALAYQEDSDLDTAVSHYKKLSQAFTYDHPPQQPRVFVSNAFSLNMLGEEAEGWHGVDINIIECPGGAHDVYDRGAISLVGHEDTARLFSSLIGEEVATNRVSVKLRRGDILFVGQYSGPRLPEGATTLPEGASIRWLRVAID